MINADNYSRATVPSGLPSFWMCQGLIDHALDMPFAPSYETLPRRLQSYYEQGRLASANIAAAGLSLPPILTPRDSAKTRVPPSLYDLYAESIQRCGPAMPNYNTLHSPLRGQAKGQTPTPQISTPNTFASLLA